MPIPERPVDCSFDLSTQTACSNQALSCPSRMIVPRCPAGYNQIATVVILGNQAAVDKVKKNEPTFMVDGSLILGKDSAITGTREDGLTAIPFSLADGALVDLSFKGGIRLHWGAQHRATRYVYCLQLP